MSMAVGEYVSVSSSRDSQRAELAHGAAGARGGARDYELAQLTELVAAQGIDQDLARRVALQLTARDALAAHARSSSASTRTS